MDIQELISYTQQLELQNKELKKHIFNIQQQLNQKNEAILLITQKRDELSEYIKKCENEIIKREERELVLLTNIDSLSKQLSIYADQIGRVKQTVNSQKQKQQGCENSIKSLGTKSMKLPPKAQQKCRNCQVVLMDKDVLILQLQKQREKIQMLTQDIQCLIGTFCFSD